MNTKTYKQTVAIVCEHVSQKRYPILYAHRTAPLEPEDSGWQFLCNSGLDEDENKAEVWTIRHVLEVEPSLEKILDQLEGTKLVRKDSNNHWTIIKR